MRNFGWLLLFGVASLCPAQTSYKDDPRLKTPVSLSYNIVATQGALADLSRQSQVELLCAQSIADYKLTAFIVKRPAVEVMDKLAQLTLGEWRSEAGSYRLFVPPKIQNEEQQALDLERATVRANAEGQVREWMRLAKLSFGEIQDRLAAVDSELTRLKGLTDDASKKKAADLTRERYTLDLLVHEPYKFYTGLVFNQLSPTDYANFWKGQPVLAATTGTKGFRPLPQEGIDHDPIVDDQPLDHKTGYLIVSYDEETGSVRIVQSNYRTPKDSGKRISHYNGQTAGTGLARTPFETTALSKTLTLWQTPFENASQPIAQRSETPVSPYYKNAFTTADHLEWLSKRCDVQILAEAFRSVRPGSFAKGNTLGAWLKAFVLEQPAFIKLEGDWLLSKPGNYWSRRAREVPERLFQPIETAAAKRPLTVDDYANFASQLSSAQMASFRVPGQVAIRFEPFALQEAGPALRFWAYLNPQQKDALSKGESLGVGAMSGPLRDAYWRTVRNFMLTQGVSDERLLMAFGAGLSDEDAAKFGFAYGPPGPGRKISRMDEDGEVTSAQACAFVFMAFEGTLAEFTTSLPKTSWPPPP